MGYKHISTEERECIMLMHKQGESTASIARATNRSRSTISRELALNSGEAGYSAAEAEAKYKRRRRACRRRRRIDDPRTAEFVADRIVNHQWSPEQIEGRCRAESGSAPLSARTVYRAIARGDLDRFASPMGTRRFSRRLRRKGRKPRRKGAEERRGKFRIADPIEARPREAEERSEAGHWEADTVEGRKGGACFVTLTDRKTRLLVCLRAASKTKADVGEAIAKALRGHSLRSITPDRGKEFAGWPELSERLGVRFYFPLPRQPWKRGTNENTNGLLREYFPKGQDISCFTDEFISGRIRELNLRPRKCLGWLTPYEAYYGAVLHLI